MYGKDSDDVPIEIELAGEDYLKETSITDNGDDVEEGVAMEQHRDSLNDNTTLDDKRMAHQPTPMF